MRAMLFETPGRPLRLADLPTPKPGAGQFLIRVFACAVCRTDLHVVDGELMQPKLPLIPGHEIVGTIEAKGDGAERFEIGDRVGIPWLGWSCGECVYCKSGKENLCDRAGFTGYTIDGGYAEHTVADQRFCFPIPSLYSDAQAAPLLCAGLIGYRSLVKAGNGKRLGIYGFGRRLTLLFKSRVTRNARSMPLLVPVTRRQRNLPWLLGLSGLVVRTNCRLRSLMRRLSLRLRVSLCLKLSGRSAKVVSLSVAVST